MIRNYILTSVRTLLRDKIFTLINISGLAVGITCGLLAILYLNEETSFDTFHADADRIYRVAFDQYGTEGAFASTPIPIGPALQEEFSAITAMTRVQILDNYLVRNEENTFFEKLTAVDSGFFDVFSFKLLQGNPAKALSGPNQIVMTESAAKKYFGDEDPVGKTLLVGSSGRLNSVVTGVVEDPPGNSQLQFDLLLSFATMEKVGFPVTLWFQMPSNYTYVLLNAQNSPSQLADRFPDFARKYLGSELKEPYESVYKMVLQPFTDIHLHSKRRAELPTQGSATSIYLFLTISGIILLIACINYTNLTSARYLRRTREVGVRKVAGATRNQIAGQLLTESLILAAVAGLFAVVALELLLPWFNELANARIEFGMVVSSTMAGAWLILILIPALFAGIAPALYLAHTNIVQSLKNSLSLPVRGLTLRKGLVIFQLFAATFLLTAALVVFRQMDFIRRSLYRHDQNDQVLVFSISGRLARSFDAVQNQLAEVPSVMGVSAASSVPGFSFDRWEVRTSPEGAPVNTENFVIDDQYLDVMGYEIIAGRNFDRAIGSDSAAFIINEKSVREFGFENPGQSIGQTIYWGSDRPKKGVIIGVVKNFNFSSYREEIQPALMQLNTFNWRRYAAVRMKMDNFSEGLAMIRKTVHAVDENWYVDYHFVDENFEKMHQRDLVLGKLFGAFAIIAILISCLGLLGLVMFATSRRTREIGIRKTLGAGAATLVTLVASEFLKLFLMAFAVSIPASYVALMWWLNGFSYRINLSPDIYLVTGALVLTAIAATIGYQILKVTRVNPVDVLKVD